MDEHPDAVTYRRTADAFRARDFDAVGEAIDEDVEWHFPGTSWLSAELRGRDKVLAYLQAAVDRTKGTFMITDELVSGYDDHVVAVQEWGATVGREAQTFTVVSVIRFESGRQSQRWFHPLDQEGLDAFFARTD